MALMLTKLDVTPTPAVVTFNLANFAISFITVDRTVELATAVTGDQMSAKFTPSSLTSSCTCGAVVVIAPTAIEN